MTAEFTQGLLYALIPVDVAAFGLVVLLYLVTKELLLEAHEAPETPPGTALFFIGFLVLLVIDLLA
jgi:ZIP family zinc transporter